jgi:hypothetical protein
MHPLNSASQTLLAFDAMENQVSFLRDERKGVAARIGIVFFWTLMAVVLAPTLQKLLSPSERADDLFIALGGALGFCIGAFAAFGSSRLAVLLAFTAILFGLLPF